MCLSRWTVNKFLIYLLLFNIKNCCLSIRQKRVGYYLQLYTMSKERLIRCELSLPSTSFKDFNPSICFETKIERSWKWHSTLLIALQIHEKVDLLFRNVDLH